MKRRRFIKKTGISVLGLSLINLTFSCNEKRISLDKLIGKSESNLSSFKKKGDADFSYYTLTETVFNHAGFSDCKAFVFCKKNKIIGYTIRYKGVDKTTNYKDKLTKKYGVSKMVYNNDFGEKYYWENGNREFNLSYTKDIYNLSQYLFYSESIVNHDFIVF